MNTTDPSDLIDTEWKCLQQYLRESWSDCRTRRHSLRTILNAIFYILRTGCPWRYLPSSFPPWQMVFLHSRCPRYLSQYHQYHIVSHRSDSVQKDGVVTPEM
jgi:transposase